VLKKLKTGDILLVDSHNFLGNVIDEFQGNRFNHAGFIVRAYGVTYVVEAVETVPDVVIGLGLQQHVTGFGGRLPEFLDRFFVLLAVPIDDQTPSYLSNQLSLVSCHSQNEKE